MPSLFISYRRTDSPDTVKLIHERLKRRLPRWEIFYDHESIPLGEQFPERLRAKVTSAAVVMVVIGPKWLEILHERREAAVDHVREEVRQALAAGTSVVPVVVGCAALPSTADLANFPDLQPLLERNGRPVRPDPDFDSDLEPIVAYLKQFDSDETIGATLADKYTLTAEAGHGGMGVVYLAQQKSPLQRTVAVKLIKPGMDSRDVLARFEAERQALAVMDHPNIAKVLDAGMTASGRPFFVMEYVKGVSITQYCDDRKLTPSARLNLFIPVCNAVQHAHQKGIIHRDIKPSNVLVEVIDGKPVAKVIDFGLAKALGQKLTDKTLYTSLDTRVGTLEYSAPEQAAGRSFDVDTRSDIYSLGVLLYELLTGTPPFTREELLKIGEEEMRRVIREEEPTRPSKKLSSSGDLPAIAANRHMEPNRLARLVQGDLDWIAMKCLEKEQARRYETANQLGQELQRYLADEPVQAGPPSAAYRLRKFARRNRAGLLTTAAVLMAVLIAASGIGWALWDHAAKEATRLQELDRRRAETERTVTVAITKAEQSEERAKQLSCATSAEARALLAEWREAEAALAEAEAAMKTGAAADELRERLTEVGRRIDAARQQAQHKEQLFRELDNARMALASIKDGKFDYSGAAAMYAAAFAAFGLEVGPGQTVALAERIRDQEPAIHDALILALANWAQCVAQPLRSDLLAISRLADKDPWRRDYRQAVAAQDAAALVHLSQEARHRALPPESLQMLALALHRNDQREEARELLRRARALHPTDFWIAFYLGNYLSERKAADVVELEERIGCYRVAMALRPDSSFVHNNLGLALADKEQMDEAIAEYKKAIVLNSKNAPAHHNLGLALADREQLDEALAAFNKAIALDPSLAVAHASLGLVLKDKKRLDEALAECQKAIVIDTESATAHECLGIVLQARDHLDEAIAEFHKAIALNPLKASTYNNLGNALYTRKHLDEALVAYQKAVALDPKNAQGHSNLGVVLRVKNRPDEAIAEHNKAIALDPKFASAHFNLALALKDKNRLDEAIAEYKKAIALDPKNPAAHDGLGVVFTARNQLDDAVAEYKKAIALDPNYANVYFNLGVVLAIKHRRDEAIEQFRKAISLDPKSAKLYIHLGNSLRATNRLDEAIAQYKTGIALDPNDAVAHHNFGDALHSKGRLDDAIAEYQKAITLDPKMAEPHNNLGNALQVRNRPDEAIAEFRKAIALNPNYANAHNGLGISLYEKEQFDEAIREHEKSISLDPKIPLFHLRLGLALQSNERLDDAIAAYKKALELDPRYALALGTLGDALVTRGEFAEARANLQKCLDLLPEKAQLRPFALQRLDECNSMIALETKLQDVLAGKARSRDNQERLNFIKICQSQRRTAAGARFYSEAFADDAKLADDLKAAYRYDAACFAALAAAGQGKDAGKLSEQQRADLRKQARQWLRADFTAWGRQLDEDAANARHVVREMTHWKDDADLAGVRDAKALEKLPQDERDDWQKLWKDVDALLTRALKAK